MDDEPSLLDLLNKFRPLAQKKGLTLSPEAMKVIEEIAQVLGIPAKKLVEMALTDPAKFTQVAALAKDLLGKKAGETAAPAQSVPAPREAKAAPAQPVPKSEAVAEQAPAPKA